MRAIRRFAGTWLLLLLTALLCARLNATQDGAGGDFDVAQSVSRAQARAYERVAPSVVSIRSFGRKREDFGSGILVSREGAVLTALHVVSEATRVAVRTSDGAEYPAERVADDPHADLALLRIKAAGRAFAPARLGDEGMIALGETVLVIGNPFGLGGSVSRGVLSARGRRRVLPGNAAPLLQTDASINPGSSGGAMVDLRGRVLGLVTAILTKDGGHQGVGFAIPASELRYALSYLLRGRSVPRTWIGVRVRPREGLEGGLDVLETVAGGPAARAGLRKGDVILRVDGQRVEQTRELRRVLRAAGVGRPLRLGIRRKADLMDLALMTASLDDKPQPHAPPSHG